MLQGLKVVEFATYIAAPGAGGMLADWGAEVIKVEAPAGDPMRAFFDSLGSEQATNPVFELDNRGKRAIVLDIAKADGREALIRLAREADVFLTNVRPGALARARLDHEALRAENPRLIYATVTGYGLEGPEKDRAGFDVAAYWSRAGVLGLTMPKGSEPFPLRTGQGDHTTSIATVAAILAAVVERERTGVGRLVETSLLKTGVYAVGSDLAIQLRLGRVASNRPRPAVVNPMANFFKSRDGRWFTLVPRQGNGDWSRIARALGRPALADDPRFAKARDRRQNGSELVATLDEGFGALTLEEIGARLDAEDMVWAPVQTAAEVTRDPQAEAAGCWVDVEDGAGGTRRSVAAPARFPGQPARSTRPSPQLGQHTDAVLAELGYGADEIAAMKASGAAG